MATCQRCGGENCVPPNADASSRDGMCGNIHFEFGWLWSAATYATREGDTEYLARVLREMGPLFPHLEQTAPDAGKAVA